MFENSGYSSQPQSFTQLNNTNDLARGVLVAEYPSATRLIGVTGVTGVPTKLMRDGVCWTTERTNVSTVRHITPLGKTITRGTVLVLGTIRNGASDSGNPGRLVGGLIHIGNSEVDYMGRYRGSLPALNDGRLKCLIVRFSSSSVSDLFINGVFYSPTSGTPSAFSNSTLTWLNDGSLPRSSAGEYSLIVAWDRMLSDAEIVNVSNNPWQIFQRRSATPIFAPTGESGVLIPELSSPGVVDLSSTSARPELNVQY